MLLTEIKDQVLAYSKPVKRTVIWKHEDESGETHEDTVDVWVRKLSYGSIERISNRPDDDSRNVATVAEGVVDEGGRPVFTIEEASRLQLSLFIAVLRVIGEINGLTFGTKTEETEASPKD